ncbi:hypothetical protein RFI_23982 [Reticulomyxa filosa]|uniref:Cell division cycle protein 123 n=1 Tax=Reticulomyxa filosa TaxID=46433 RepID=X6MHD4_RETFI|nr:hypothetical protein RFI_23982 [Reticulomyxa filosa]|eukprot:ETO13393.1 hypothetical protein RFI_23982 [Reticulomyxa filosa]
MTEEKNETTSEVKGATQFESKLLLSDEEILKRGVSPDSISQYRQQKYRESYTLEKWLSIPELEKHTFTTLFLQLTFEQADVFLASARYIQACISRDRSKNQTEFKSAAIDDWNANKEAYEKVLNQLAQDIDTLLFETNKWDRSRGFFAKFNSRSPKDVFNYQGGDKRLRELYFENLDELLFQTLNLPRRSRATPNEAVWAWYITTAKLLKMTCGKDVLDTFSASFRSLEDLQAEIALGEKHMNLSLAFRQWEDKIPYTAHGEFRGFVNNRQLNAVTQYMSMIQFPVHQTLEKREWYKEHITQFFESQVKEFVPFDSYVIDFLVFDDGRVAIIEFNPFYTKAGSGLFAWKTDRELFLNGPLEFRFLLQPDPTVINNLHNSWKDAFDRYLEQDRRNPNLPNNSCSNCCVIV